MSTQCLKCGYSITEPVCSSCVIKEFKVWLSEKKIKEKTVKKINREFKSLSNRIASIDYVILPSQNIWNEPTLKCVKCEKEMHIMCFYCVVNHAVKILENNLVDDSFIESFHESFNTDFYDYDSF